MLMHTLKIHIVSPMDSMVNMQEIRAGLERNVQLLPMLRRRVVFVPFGLHHPVVIEDPDFDLDFHICRAALPAPGGMQELDEMVAQIASHALDRSCPLWELWVLEGLSEGRIAIVHKLHHTLADGMASMGFISRAWQPGASDEQVAAWKPESVPSARKLVWDAMVDHVKYDARNFPAFVRTLVRNVRTLIRHKKATGDAPGFNPLSASFPRTRFNYALSHRRTFGTTTIALDDIRELKSRLGGTVNDVVLALAAGALRYYLQHHNELPDKPLSVTIPVAVDDAGAKRLSGNNVAHITSLLHVDIADPVQRFKAMQKATKEGKEELAILGKYTFGELMQYVPPGLFAWSSRRAFRKRLADKPNHRVISNLTVSNVPGPREKLSDGKGEMESLYSIGPIVEGMGLNITVWSYVDQMNFSVLACKKAVPDIHHLTACLRSAFEELQQAVDVQKVGQLEV